MEDADAIVITPDHPDYEELVAAFRELEEDPDGGIVLSPEQLKRWVDDG